uniref:Uncharacterized protein n=1 Tax=Arundo donax TaxID=35708 RepID=A0A0A9E5Y2_ARUDO
MAAKYAVEEVVAVDAHEHNLVVPLPPLLLRGRGRRARARAPLPLLQEKPEGHCRIVQLQSLA